MGFLPRHRTFAAPVRRVLEELERAEVDLPPEKPLRPAMPTAVLGLNEVSPQTRVHDA
jgi:hypothetical protein